MVIMKKLYQLLCLPVLLLAATGCSTEDGPQKNAYAISFTLQVGNSAEGEAPQDSELTADDVRIWMFDTDGNFIDMLTPEQSSGTFGTDTDREGTYDIYVSANADITAEGIRNLDDWKSVKLSSALSPDGSLPMVSENPRRVELKKGKDLFLGDITLIRLAARIEVLNYAEGLEITSVTIRNVAGSCNVGAEGSELREIKLEGSDITSGTGVAAHVYSYPFTPAEPGQNISAEIAYTLSGEAGTIYSSFGSNETIPVGCNSIYSVVIRGEGQSAGARTVATWSVGATSDNVVEVPLSQEERNKALLVCRFAATDVMEIDNDALTVTFCKENNSKDYGEEDAAYFWSWEKKYADNTYTAEDGHKYKVPSSDEMSLLCPLEKTVTFSSEKEYLGVSERLPDLLGIAGSGGNGKSDFRSVKTGSPEDNMPYHTCYAVRFRNTRQTAAYRYRWEKFADEIDDAHITVRIKACDNDQSLDEVCEESWWQDGYVEYIIPAHGYGGGTGVIPIDIRNRGKYAYYWTSDYIGGQVNVAYLSSSGFDHNTWMSEGGAYTVRMIRVD